MNAPSRTVPVILYPEGEQLLATYRAALEQLDGHGSYARFSDADLIAMALRAGMREAIEAAKLEGSPR